MAFTPYTLTKATTFTRSNSNESVTLQAGEVVQYERTESDTHIFHTARIRRDGSTWFSIHTVPKAVSAPVNNGHVASAVQATAKDARSAVDVIVGREMSKTLDSEEKKVRQLSRIADILSGEVYQVNYYIPTSLSKKVGQKHINIFRRHGFRLDGSNWVFSAKGLEAKSVKEVFAYWDKMKPVESECGLPGFMNRTQVRYWVVQYTKDQLAKMREAAITQLSDELIKTHTSLVKRIDKAARSLAKAQEALGDNASANARSEAEQAFATRLRVTVKDACERFEMCLKGAEIFDDTGSLDSLFEAVRAIVQVKAMSVNVLLATRGMKQVKVPKAVSAPANSIVVTNKSINPSNLPAKQD